ncbi:MAG: dienelactone hydrolase family protein [Chitinophagaceae bacterium]
MKSLLCGLLLLSVLFSRAQSRLNCCSKEQSPTQSFAMLGGQPAFQAAHLQPLPYHLKNKSGKDFTFPTPDGMTAHGYLVLGNHPTRNYLLVFHEWWGLNDYIRQMSDQLKTDLGRVNVIAVDLYDGQTATTAARAGAIMQQVKESRAISIIKGVLQYAGKNARIATIGWCFGGGWSLQATLLAGKQAIGCVMYYGMPDPSIARLKTLHADVLGIFANQDGWITPKVVGQFEQHMLLAGKKLIVHQYNAVHGFANPSNPKHDIAATASAYQYTLDFLKARLKN